MSTPWTFPLGAPADSRRDLPVFSVMPNWKNGITEQISWLTEVLGSEMAAEQRRPLRLSPRRTFEASFMRADADRSRLDLFLAGTGKKKCLVPLWHEQFELGEGNSNGSIQFPAGTLKTREWPVGSLAMITNGDASIYAVLWVNAVDLAIDQIQLTALANVGPWLNGCRIYPLRVARVLDQAKLGNPTDRVAVTQIRFALSDPDHSVVPGFGNLSKTWLFKPNRSIAIDIDYFRNDFIIDYEVGKVEVVDPSNQVQTVQAIGLRLFGRADIYKFRQFLYAARGKLHGFFMPTFMQDLLPLEDLSGNSFDCKVNGFFDYIKEPQDARLRIMIEFKDGQTQYFAGIKNVEPVLDSVPPYRQVAERFTVEDDDAFPTTIARADIARISFLVYSRFDQDTFELEHHTADGRVVSSKVMARPVVDVGDVIDTPGGPGVPPLAPQPPVYPAVPVEPTHIPVMIRKFYTVAVETKPLPGGGSDSRYGFFVGDFDEQGNGTYALMFTDEYYVATESGHPFGVGDTTTAVRIQQGNYIGTDAHCYAFVGREHRERVGDINSPEGVYWITVSYTEDHSLADYVNDYNAVEAAKDLANQTASAAYQAAMLQWYAEVAYYNAAYDQYLIDLAAWEEQWGGV